MRFMHTARRKAIALALALGLALAGSLGYVVGGLHAYGQYQLTYSAYATTCNTLLAWDPPAELFTGFYPNMPALLTLRYRSPSAQPQTLRVSVSIPGFTQEESVEQEAYVAFREQSFKPPLLNGDVLDALVGPRQRNAQIVVRIESLGADGKLLCDTSAPVLLKSRQQMRWYDPVTGDNSPYLAGWVTPQASVIGALVGLAAQRLTQRPDLYADTPALYGYDEGRASSDAVRAQVNAIFDTLQFTYHLRYAADNIPYAQDATQIIQLPKDVLTSSAPTGMCVETTAILASAVERLGMRPYIIITPGHAYLGVALGPQANAPRAYWETSDLNGGVLGDQANTHGDLEYNTDQHEGHVLKVIDVLAERQQGIEPME